jgi:PAS domain S-box-containing protein
MRQRGDSHAQDGWIRDYPAEEAMIAGFGSSPIPMILCDARAPDIPIIFVNSAFEALTGYSADDVLGRNCRFLRGSRTSGVASEQIRAALMKAQPISVDILNYKKDGSSFWNALTIAPMNGSDGKPLYYFATMLDASERSQALAHLQTDNTQLKSDVASKILELDAALALERQAARDNAVLLNELHHRVRNNLQMISAMISMQIRNLDDRRARDALVSLMRRVNALGAVHRRLHDATSVGVLNLANAIEEMVPEAVSAYATKPIKVGLALDALYLHCRLAAPTAVLLNEILAHVLTAANVTADDSEIAISLHRDRSRAVVSFQIISKDGQNDGATLTPLHGNALTLALTRQLNGNLQWVPDPNRDRIELHIPVET